MPAPTLRMSPARERRMWLALVASAGASFTVGMSAREKSMAERRQIAREGAGYTGANAAVPEGASLRPACSRPWRPSSCMRTRSRSASRAWTTVTSSLATKVSSRRRRTSSTSGDVRICTWWMPRTRTGGPSSRRRTSWTRSGAECIQSAITRRTSRCTRWPAHSSSCYCGGSRWGGGLPSRVDWSSPRTRGLHRPWHGSRGATTR